MATSGVWTYNVTALQVITAAAEDIGCIANGQSLDANDLATFLRTLNLLVKQWQGKSDKFPGLKIWTRQRLRIFFVSGQNRYLVGPAATDDRASVNALATTLAAAKGANSTTPTLSTAIATTTGDQIGFVTAAGPIAWTTIASGGGTTTPTLAANTVGAAASGAVVFTYTSKSQRFVWTEAALLRDDSADQNPTDIPIQVYTDVGQYEALTQKFASGDPTACLIEPGRLNTAVTFNFATANVYKSARLTVIYPSEDYVDVTGADDISYPQEYFAALEWELAFRCAPKFGKKWTDGMKNVYTAAVSEGVNLNADNTADHFQPERDFSDTGSPFTRP